MKLKSLCVAHIPNDLSMFSNHQLQDLSAILEHAVYLDTCQRKVWVFDQSDIELSVLLPWNPMGLELLQGKAAYEFLVLVSCGLKSKVPGETEVFGQMRDAWLKYQKKMQADCSKYLFFWMQKLYEDTKDIRSSYLESLGGSSYGTLVRLFLKLEETNVPDSNPAPNSDTLQTDKILLVGCGKLAQAIAPYLVQKPLLLWNRNSLKSRQWLKTLKELYPTAQIKLIEDEALAWEQSTVRILCIPPDEKDEWRVQVQGSTIGKIIHLGYQTKSESPYRNCQEFYALESLFQLQSTQDEARLKNVKRAKEACRQRAILRHLDSSISTPHGWEDLQTMSWQ